MEANHDAPPGEVRRRRKVSVKRVDAVLCHPYKKYDCGSRRTLECLRTNWTVNEVIKDQDRTKH